MSCCPDTLLIVLIKIWLSAPCPISHLLISDSCRRRRIIILTRHHHRWDRRDKPRMTCAETLIKCHTTNAHSSLNILYHIKVQLLLLLLQLQLLLFLLLQMLPSEIIIITSFLSLQLLLVVLTLPLNAAHCIRIITIIAVWGDDHNLFAFRMIVGVAVLSGNLRLLRLCIFVLMSTALRLFLQICRCCCCDCCPTWRLLFSVKIQLLFLAGAGSDSVTLLRQLLRL